MMIDHEMREYWKDQTTRREGAEPGDVTMAVVNIYQSEFGHMFEDEAFGDLLDQVVGLAEKYHAKAKSYDELVDVILEEMHRADAEAARQAEHAPQIPTVNF